MEPLPEATDSAGESAMAESLTAATETVAMTAVLMVVEAASERDDEAMKRREQAEREGESAAKHHG